MFCGSVRQFEDSLFTLLSHTKAQCVHLNQTIDPDIIHFIAHMCQEKKS